MVRPEFVSVDMSLEQAAAMRAILKLEHIRSLGAVTATHPDVNDLQRLEMAVSLTDRWATLDRPFGIAMFNIVAGDQPVNLSTPLRVLMTKADKVQLAEVLYRGHYLEVLKSAKSVDSTLVSGFISVVLIERNYKALRELLLPLPDDNKPFSFEQTPPPKGVLN